MTKSLPLLVYVILFFFVAFLFFCSPHNSRCLPKPVRECCRLQTLTLTLTSTLLSKHKESVAVSGFEQLCHVTRAASGEDLPGNWPRQRGDGTWEQLRASGYEGSVALVAANHCHALLQIYQFHSWGCFYCFCCCCCYSTPLPHQQTHQQQHHRPTCLYHTQASLMLFGECANP